MVAHIKREIKMPCLRKFGLYRTTYHKILVFRSGEIYLANWSIIWRRDVLNT